mgnify:CR=1 FL=1
MLKKRTKIFILAAMVLLLGVTGYLNIALNNNITTQTNANVVTQANYFDTYRDDRQSTRDQELLYYDAIINSESSTADAIANAEAKKMEIVNTMESELVMEGLIKAKGFEDVIVTNSANNINVIVKAANLESSQVAQIVEIVKQQTSKSIDNIKIIPVE